MVGQGYKIIVRPHPEYTKRYRARWEALQARYAEVPEDELWFERDFSSNESIFAADVLVTDWSSVFCEFCFSTLKPAIFIDTPMKVSNPDWQELGLEPTDISLRTQVGRTLEMDDLDGFADEVAAMLSEKEDWHGRISEVRDALIFNLGHSAQVAGEFLLETVLVKQGQRREAAAPASLRDAANKEVAR